MEGLPKNNFTTNIMQAFVQKTDIKQIFKELIVYINHEKHDHIGIKSDNYRDVYSDRKIKTEYMNL